MRISHINDPGTHERALELLRDGGVVVLPTDTLYGFHAAVSRRKAVERISEAKGAGHGRRYLLLAASLEMVEAHVASLGCASRAQLDALWPSPVTVILPAGRACPDWVGDTVAFRVPARDALRALIKDLGEPIVSTSVNASGETPVNDPLEIAARYDADLMVDGGDADASASTIVDVCGESPLVIRQGDYPWPAATGDSNPSK